nr:protein kinase [Alkalihalobacillus pseudalcaliphilus]
MGNNSFLKDQETNLPSGFRIEGKWHGHTYIIRKKLGAGATGTVYLAENNLSQIVAVKIATDSMNITSEVNVLKRFSKIKDKKLGPTLMDVDDFVTAKGNLPFYVMEYVKGQPIIDYMKGKGAEWLGLLVIQLLGDLEHLHREGWAFGDLKPDNLLVVDAPVRARWIDVGGITLLGRAIKEFTEFYDRGYWGLGTRKAEPSYDLFAVAMVMIHCEYGDRFEKTKEPPLSLFEKKINQRDHLKIFKPVLLKALTGKYGRAIDMKEDLVKIVARPNKDKRTKMKKVKVSAGAKSSNQQRKKRKPSFLVEIFLVITLIIFGYILYLFGQMM